jgi:hypothetical protein
MCVNCISNAEAVATGAIVASYMIKPPVHRALAKLGVVNAPDRIARDVTTVGFLRSLDLDPVEVLGADVVATAEAWIAPQPARGVTASLTALAASARPIGSQRMLSTQ